MIEIKTNYIYLHIISKLKGPGQVIGPPGPGSGGGIGGDPSFWPGMRSRSIDHYEMGGPMPMVGVGGREQQQYHQQQMRQQQQFRQQQQYQQQHVNKTKCLLY
jgi:hypothetical protein